MFTESPTALMPSTVALSVSGMRYTGKESEVTYVPGEGVNKAEGVTGTSWVRG